MRFFYLLALFVGTLAQGQTLTGTVRDVQTNVPVAGATVRLGTLGTTTDEAGRFRLTYASVGTFQVMVSSVGYRAANVPIRLVAGDNLPLLVPLEPTVVQLNQQRVVTTHLTETPDFERPELTTVVGAREVRQRAFRTVPEALVGAMGVFLQKTNQGGGSPFVRGLTGQQTLLLVDGIRLNNSTFRAGPNQYLNTIDPGVVSHLEVARGNGATVYGSDALGGAINVLTRSPQFLAQRTQTGRAVQVGGSVWGKLLTQGMEQSGRAEVSVASGSVAVLGGLAYRRFGDLVAGRGLGRLSPTGYTQLSGDVKTRLRLAARWVGTLAYQAVQQDSVPVYHRVALENYRYFQMNPQQRQLAYARLNGYVGHWWLQSVQLTALWQRQAEARQSQRNNSPTVIYEADQTTTTGLTLLANAQPRPGWQLQYGADLYADRVGSTRRDLNTQTGANTFRRGLYPDGATMSSLALYTTHTLTLNRLTLTGGARYNAFSIRIPEAAAGGAAQISPAAVVGQAGASYALLPTLRVVGSVQSAFRAPNVDDLGTLGIVDFRYELPNADLRPERALTKELGLKLRSDRLAATLAVYHNALTDVITRVRAGRDSLQGYPVYLKQNTAQAFIRGLETDVEYELARHWLLAANLTYTYGQNLTAGEPYRRIPPLHGRVGLTYQAPQGWWFRSELLYAGAQTRLAAADVADNRITKGGTPGWQVLNLNGGYRWHSLTVSAEWQNLTNTPYRTHGSGVDGVGSSAWLSAVWQW
jgi:hemoglobin/transferrin/lactoferrin receptor protein